MSRLTQEVEEIRAVLLPMVDAVHVDKVSQLPEAAQQAFELMIRPVNMDDRAQVIVKYLSATFTPDLIPKALLTMLEDIHL